MRLRLIYQGELRATQGEPREGQLNRMAEHKQAIRKVFHRQLKHFWGTNQFLSSCKVYGKDYGISRPVANTTAYYGSPPEDGKTSLMDAVAYNHRENGYQFVPLVRKDWGLLCTLEILFMRHEPPGGVLAWPGDLDNRVKTLIDALRKPTNGAELHGNETPAEGETPFFCLLEDDKLVSGLAVETDRLLEPPNGKRDEDLRQAHVVVTANVRPIDVTQFNLSFVS